MKTAQLVGSAEPVRIGKILCIGRNYADHIKELGNEVPERPVIFTKPATCVIGAGEEVVIPSYSSDCHHEAELALLIGRKGSNIPPEQALSHVAGYAVAIDLTLRDVQAELKKKGLPWDIAKGFDTACPLSPFVPAEQVADPHQLRITLTVNGEKRQDGGTELMIHRIPELLAYLSSIFTLEPGDLVLTGTPAGVGPIKSGDRVVAEIAGVGNIAVSVR
ncbi:fumarylacetoacetate hydrolase family protein [Geomonas sp. Red69]|uniref:Fumarylacetoacetate hydrolase family protein n=1 Tax=Geomonas diazotrophica TaxID=2843197 RepID=A0ABX8JKE0_9BACT|nr:MULTISPECIES: fumarylacetoacetate hydrolase family protein [Geomonas]MBU5635659.1 fumarylacetoacetate hydrolase family protein [Geomonas diazotrophica]QWV98099.1 fumarylacetoacetate hydrolase family protein [Geomonas nitrogeniifigens]QXE87230.1 fumarylacetoacetate hydrolase family protein [Geomonas nitrogeniifigens]